MARIIADYPKNALAADDFAFLATLFNSDLDFHVSRLVILPLVKSYGLNSTVTRSPGSILIRFLRILPLLPALRHMFIWPLLFCRFFSHFGFFKAKSSFCNGGGHGLTAAKKWPSVKKTTKRKTQNRTNKCKAASSRESDEG